MSSKKKSEIFLSDLNKYILPFDILSEELSVVHEYWFHVWFQVLHSIHVEHEKYEKKRLEN